MNTKQQRMLDADGEVVTIGGRDFEWHAEVGSGGWTHVDCGQYVGFGDRAVADHVCEPGR